MQTTVKDIIDIMEANYPLFLAEEWDNCGLQVGSFNQAVNTVAVALDPSPEIVSKAREVRADLLITHHPLLFNPLKSLDFGRMPGSLIKTIIESQISVYSAHTNLDSAARGINQFLAEMFGLECIEPLPGVNETPLMKLAVFVPAGHYEKVRQAIFDAGAGHIGKYDSCSFGARGTGTFRALEGANPYIGSLNQLEEVQEVRLESVFYQSEMKQVITAMLEAHPYEEAAYDLYRLSNPGRPISAGRVGRLKQPVKLEELVQQVKGRLSLDAVRVVGKPGRKVSRVAVVSGSGASFIDRLIKDGVDVLITGDLKYHEACLARDNGFSIIDAGHQGTEQVMVEIVTSMLQKETEKGGNFCKIIGLYEEKCMNFY